MNALPHVHALVIERRYNAIDEGPWYVVYGTTKVKFASRFARPHTWSAEKQKRVIGRAVRRAVHRHDEASRQQETPNWRRAVLDDLRLFTKPVDGWDGKWASEHMKESVS